MRSRSLRRRTPVRVRVLRLVVAAVVATVAGLVRVAYVRDLVAARKRIGSTPRHMVESRFGAIDYAGRGAGDPLLVSHGIFQGCDGGLLSMRDLVADRRIIAPSRFGYLGSMMPDGASVADQADAFAELLDHLGYHEVDAVGLSAGTSAAVRFALRHPGRVRHLVVISGSFPGSRTTRIPPRWARSFYNDPAMWSLKYFARPAFFRLLGVPRGFPRSPAQRHVLTELSNAIFPIGLRRRGAVFDAYVADPDINTYPLEEIAVPTLIVHAVDDPLTSYSAAAEAASRIPGARLVSLDSGGHLLLGQSERVRRELADFLAQNPDD